MRQYYVPNEKKIFILFGSRKVVLQTDRYIRGQIIEISQWLCLRNACSLAFTQNQFRLFTPISLLIRFSFSSRNCERTLSFCFFHLLTFTFTLSKSQRLLGASLSNNALSCTEQEMTRLPVLSILRKSRTTLTKDFQIDLEENMNQYFLIFPKLPDFLFVNFQLKKYGIL